MPKGTARIPDKIAHSAIESTPINRIGEVTSVGANKYRYNLRLEILPSSQWVESPKTNRMKYKKDIATKKPLDSADLRSL
jgi:hypothetical protein